MPVAKEGMHMRAAVDADRCQGHLRCAVFAPTVFEVDDYGHATTAGEDVDPSLDEDVRKAVLNCPERAIEVVEDGEILGPESLG
jgi:ferredoxin